MVHDAEDQRLLVSAIGKSNRVCRKYDVNTIRIALDTTWKGRDTIIFVVDPNLTMTFLRDATRLFETNRTLLLQPKVEPTKHQLYQ